MAGRALGNARESALANDLDKIGYHVIGLRGSGCRGAAMRRRENQFAGDLLAIPANREAQLPWLQVEVGGRGKSIRRAFAELEKAILPGFRPLVVCYQKRKGAKRASRFYYTSPLDCVEKLNDAIYVLRPGEWYRAVGERPLKYDTTQRR